MLDLEVWIEKMNRGGKKLLYTFNPNRDRNRRDAAALLEAELHTVIIRDLVRVLKSKVIPQWKKYAKFVRILEVSGQPRSQGPWDINPSII